MNQSTAKIFPVNKVTKKRYEQTFKEEAVKLSKEIGIKRAARILNMPFDTLNGWLRKEKKLQTSNIDVQEAFDAGKVLAENYELKKENDILKAALAFFIKEERHQ